MRATWVWESRLAGRQNGMIGLMELRIVMEKQVDGGWLLELAGPGGLRIWSEPPDFADGYRRCRAYRKGREWQVLGSFLASSSSPADIASAFLGSGLLDEQPGAAQQEQHAAKLAAGGRAQHDA